MGTTTVHIFTVQIRYNHRRMPIMINTINSNRKLTTDYNEDRNCIFTTSDVKYRNYMYQLAR